MQSLGTSSVLRLYVSSNKASWKAARKAATKKAKAAKKVVLFSHSSPSQRECSVQIREVSEAQHSANLQSGKRRAPQAELRRRDEKSGTALVGGESYGRIKSEYGDGFIVSPEAPLERIDAESGLPVYKAHLLKVGEGGGTALCPFDCDCCF